MSILQKSNKKISSRRNIKIDGVQDSILILPNNQYRIVLEVSAVNFDLKSEDEKDAILETYQSFLSSLAFPIQIVTRTRRMDMNKYLDSFTRRLSVESDPIYQVQLENYIEFVQKLAKKNKILSRVFYVVVPYFDKDKADFYTIADHLGINRDVVTKGLARLGIHASQVEDIAILDLFYSYYNPGHAKRQPLKDQTLHLLNSEYVKRGQND